MCDDSSPLAKGFKVGGESLLAHKRDKFQTVNKRIQVVEGVMGNFNCVSKFQRLLFYYQILPYDEFKNISQR